MFPDYKFLLDDPVFAEFFQAWRDARCGAEIPCRKDIKLQTFARYAESLMIFERDSEQELKCRLIGSKLSDRVGAIDNDVNWLDLMASDAKETALEWWRTAFNTPCAGLLQFSVSYPNGNNNLAHALFVPLRSNDGGVHMLGLIRNLGIYRVDPASDALLYGQDFYQATYVDVGYGLPSGHPKSVDFRPMDPAIEKLGLIS